jgi:hypothetical protein
MQIPVMFDFPTTGFIFLSYFVNWFTMPKSAIPYLRCVGVPTEPQPEDTLRLESRIGGHKHKFTHMVIAKTVVSCLKTCLLMLFVHSICATCNVPSLRSSEYPIKYAEDQSSSLQSLYARTAEMLGTGRFQTDR